MSKMSKLYIELIQKMASSCCELRDAIDHRNWEEVESSQRRFQEALVDGLAAILAAGNYNKGGE